MTLRDGCMLASASHNSCALTCGLCYAACLQCSLLARHAPALNLACLLLLLLPHQVMSPELMYRHPAVFAGRPLNFREAGFLGNGRTPSWLRHAATAVASGSAQGCEGGAKCAQALGRKPPQGVNQQVGRELWWGWRAGDAGRAAGRGGDRL